MRLLLIPSFLMLFVITGNEKLIGRWESPVSPKGNTTGVIFKADSTFDAYVNNKPFTSGPYRLNNDTFSFSDNGCDGKQGIYKITFFSNEDSFRLTPIDDPCEERKNGMSKLVLGRKKLSIKAELGKLLFFDPILSGARTISCASCHKPAYAFADTTALSPGVSGRKGTRNTPSAMNIATQDIFFWDGRARTLEEQALAPIENPVEMNLPLEQALRRLRHHKKYRDLFRTVFNSDPTRAYLAEAIAAFERTLETSNSPFDNWKMSGDDAAVPEAVKRGFTLFGTKGKCTKCHFGSDFTQREFRNIGLFDGVDLHDSGRASLPGLEKELGKFKVPGLRNIAITAPYMHNGMFRTLREVIEFYNDPEKVVPHAINRDTVLAKPLGLTEREKADLEAFLVSLTDKQFAGTGR